MLALDFLEASETLSSGAFDILDFELRVLSLTLHFFLELVELVFLDSECRLRVNFELVHLLLETLLESFKFDAHSF